MKATNPARVAVIFVNYGPYHIARARALADRPDFDPIFIELASAQRKYTWEIDKEILCGRLITLATQPYEDCQPRELSRMLVDTLTRLQPATVVLAGYGDAPMRAAARWARTSGAGIVVMSESNEDDHERQWWKEWLKRRWFNRYVDAGFAGGRRAHAYLAKLGVPEGRIWERYDVVDNAYFALQAERLRTGADVLRMQAGLPPQYFLYVGRFAPEKNLLFLLEAYRRYRQMHPAGWGLVLVGDGPQRDQLRHAATAHGLTGVVWPGYKQFDQLPPYYSLAGCFVLPSILEPWGLVMNEAMACGLPVIASRRCGSAADLVQEGRNGFTFEPTDSGQLAELMGRVGALSDAQLAAMGLASREIISQWTPEVWASQLACAIRAAGTGYIGRPGAMSAPDDSAIPPQLTHGA